MCQSYPTWVRELKLHFEKYVECAYESYSMRVCELDTLCTLGSTSCTRHPAWVRELKPVVEVAVVEVLLLYISLVGGLFLLFLLFLLRLWALVYGILKDGG